ncbi:hypothetical protein WICPIJ_001636 [Wickerhamomyces pijperi]|uniref:Large ribosomal subunit protein bL32m n=1 Tax=Wickerhamomyces pijperi TaxID=599730 RepID=A0A9P8QD79_WICPI|nr:hypothetical protein WICPIJ_001636 [Wickerhamomyces pijperi]
MSLSITVLDSLAGALTRLPRLPQIQVIIPNPFAPQARPQQAATEQQKTLREKLQEYINNAVDAAPLIPTGLLEGLLRAVPKKKVSHRRKRNRQLQGDKQLKLLNNLNRCPSCGHIKRSHTLCMHCVEQIKSIWRTEAKLSEKEPFKQELDPVDQKLIYPGKRESPYEKQMNNKKEWLERRQRTFELNRKESK